VLSFCNDKCQFFEIYTLHQPIPLVFRVLEVWS